ncbi:MAG: hypothetical protein ACRDGM_20490, partial [bacterium]
TEAMSQAQTMVAIADVAGPVSPGAARQNGWTSQPAGARITLEAAKQNGAEPHAGGWSNAKGTIRRS